MHALKGEATKGDRVSENSSEVIPIIFFSKGMFS